MSNRPMTIQEFLAGLKSLHLVRVLVGPAGVHYDFAKNLRTPFTMGILSNTAVRVYSKGCGKVLETLSNPPYACQPELQKWLLGRVVTEAEIQPKNNTAIIVLDDQIALKLTPEVRKSDVCWSIHMRSPETKRDWIPGLVVYADALSEVEWSGA